VFFWNTVSGLFSAEGNSVHTLQACSTLRQSTASRDSQVHLRRALWIQAETVLNALRAWKYSYVLRAVLQNRANATANHPSFHSLNTAGPLQEWLMVGATNSCLTGRQVQPNTGNLSRRFLQDLPLAVLPCAALSYQILGFRISSTFPIELSEKRPDQALPLSHPK